MTPEMRIDSGCRFSNEMADFSQEWQSDGKSAM
jgi:hypothetical protein